MSRPPRGGPHPPLGTPRPHTPRVAHHRTPHTHSTLAVCLCIDDIRALWLSPLSLFLRSLSDSHSLTLSPSLSCSLAHSFCLSKFLCSLFIADIHTFSFSLLYCSHSHSLTRHRQFCLSSLIHLKLTLVIHVISFIRFFFFFIFFFISLFLDK